MIRKTVIWIFMAALFLPIASYAQEGLQNDSIVILKTEESGVPGYVHQQYLFIDQNCPGPKQIDYYGPPIDPNDASLQRLEHAMCLDSQATH